MSKLMFAAWSEIKYIATKSSCLVISPHHSLINTTNSICEFCTTKSPIVRNFLDNNCCVLTTMRPAAIKAKAISVKYR